MILKSEKSVKVGNRAFHVNGKPFFMYSGEIHYFRMPCETWKLHLRKACQAGLNTVSTYIPWSWHEYEEGKFDFEGKTHPQRNLFQFMDLAREAGLFFTARVGPVSNAELEGEGIPGWLLRDHPEIFVQKNGVNNLPHVILLSYLNPTFQEYMKKWYDRVLPIVSERQIHRGGNVIMVQLCNEIGMIHWLLKGSDHSPVVTQMYRKFLEEKYKTVSALNRSYSTHYSGFSEVPQPVGEVDDGNLGIFFDWSLFYRRYYAAYYGTLFKEAGKHAITVLHSANAPQFYDYDVRGRGVFSPMTTSLYRDFSAAAPSTVFGGAYQMRRLDFENFHDVSITTEVIKLLDEDAPVVCAEMQTGIMRDRPRLYPSDVELNIKTSVAHGLNGINCYMFSSGQNVSGMGIFGTQHDWQAPVSLRGEERDHFLPLKEWGKFVRRHGLDLAETRKVTDTTLGFYLPYYATEYYTGPWVARIETARNQLFYDGMARIIQLAGFNFSMSDLMKESDADLARRESLCLFSLDFMDEDTQTKIARYVSGGGRLLVGPRMPSRDLHGRPCAVLAKSLGLSYHEQTRKEMLLWNGNECAVEFPIQSFNGAKNHPLIKTKSGLACVSEGRSGRGRWVSYGFGLSHLYDYQVRMAREWLDHLGIRPHLSIEPWDVHAVVRWGRDRGFLFILNYHDVTKKGRVRVDLRKVAKSTSPLTINFRLERRSGEIVPLILKKNKITEVRQ